MKGFYLFGGARYSAWKAIGGYPNGQEGPYNENEEYNCRCSKKRFRKNQASGGRGIGRCGSLGERRGIDEHGRCTRPGPEEGRERYTDGKRDGEKSCHANCRIRQEEARF